MRFHLESDRSIRNIRFLVLFVFLVFGGGETAYAQTEHDPQWYKEAVIYNLDVHTFKDSDGNGVGDFNGLTSKLDYLQSLGINTLWLSPFQASPHKDDGYDITDFEGIDPRVGTKADFQHFMGEAKKRHIRVIMDLVVNHTSDQHPWFLDAINDPNSKYRNWYVWSEKRPRDWNRGMVFPGVQKDIWTFSPEAGEYYYHRFYHFEPSLNLQNPEVQAYVRDLLGYWLEQGVDGFHVDAVPFVIEKRDHKLFGARHDFTMLADLQRFISSKNPDAVMLGEANVKPSESKDYFGAHGEGLQMIFNFHVNQYLFLALATEKASPLEQALKATSEKPNSSQWAYFLRSHDELDLGRLSWLRRQEVFHALGPDQNMQIYNRGIRRRLAPMLDNDIRRLELAYALEFAFPGTPVLRYGDEIGMGDNLDLKERLSVRTPMQWTDGRNAGFSSGIPFRPVITSNPFGFAQVNVSSEEQDPRSLFSWMKRLIALRKDSPEISLGEPTVLATSSSHVMALQYSYQGKSLLTVFNFSKSPQDVAIKSINAIPMEDLLKSEILIKVQKGVDRFEMPPYGFGWFRPK